MPIPPALTLIASQPALEPSSLPADEMGRAPALARLAGRGTVTTCEPRDAALEPWQYAVLHTLELAEDAARWPSAPLSALGSVAAIDGWWLHAVPMHFAAGMNDIVAVTLSGDARPTADDLTELSASLSRHLVDAGVELIATGERWLLRAARALDVRTVHPAAATARGLKASLPEGPDAGELRRLMTELQMLMHEHPVNARRARAGLPDINAIWPWGQGASPLPQSRGTERWPRAIASQPYVRGIYRLHGAAVDDLPRDGGDVLAGDEPARELLVVVDAADLAELDARWIAPLSAALREGRLLSLSVYVDRCRVHATRLHLRRFWRRDRALAQRCAP